MGEIDKGKEDRSKGEETTKTMIQIETSLNVMENHRFKMEKTLAENTETIQEYIRRGGV